MRRFCLYSAVRYPVVTQRGDNMTLEQELQIPNLREYIGKYGMQVGEIPAPDYVGQNEDRSGVGYVMRNDTGIHYVADMGERKNFPCFGCLGLGDVGDIYRNLVGIDELLKNDQEVPNFVNNPMGQQINNQNKNFNDLYIHLHSGLNSRVTEKYFIESFMDPSIQLKNHTLHCDRYSGECGLNSNLYLIELNMALNESLNPKGLIFHYGNNAVEIPKSKD